MSNPKPPPKFVLTPEQRKIVEEVRRLAEIEKPEILAEGRRVFEAEQCMNGRLQAVMSILKAVRNSQKVTLEELAARTGMTKPYLSKLENDAQHIYDVSSAKVFEATRIIRGLERLAR